MPFSDALIVDYVGRSIGRSRCDPWENARFVMTEERLPKVEGLTPEELAEKQRMNIMGIKLKSNLEPAAAGTAKAAEKF